MYSVLLSHDPAAGRIVVHPSTTPGSRAGLAHDILAALGAPITALDHDRVAGAVRAWRAALTWLRTDRGAGPGDAACTRLDRPLWADLAEMAAATGVRPARASTTYGRRCRHGLRWRRR